MECEFIREIKVDLPDNRHEYVEVFVGTIFPIAASQVLEKLAVDLPLQQFYLNHLKRIRRITNNTDNTDQKDSSNNTADQLIDASDNMHTSVDRIDKSSIVNTNKIENKHNNITLEVLVCPVSHKDYINMTLYSQYFDTFKSVKVPKYEPNTYDEYVHANSVWPTSFKRNHKSFQVIMDEILNSEFIIKENIKLALNDLNKCIVDFKWESDKCGGIIVNPKGNLVVASCYDVISYNLGKYGDKYRTHPLLSPTLMCIDGVSLICRDEIENKGVLYDDHYLCTGLDLYVVNEPDIMSGMALVHSRIRNVYYLQSDTKYGALGSIYKIHSMRTLNHKYKVYQINIESLKDNQDTSSSASAV